MEPKWEMGFVQDGPMHDAGLRFFVIARGFPRVQIAWTTEEKHAEMIIQALEQAAPGT